MNVIEQWSHNKWTRAHVFFDRLYTVLGEKAFLFCLVDKSPYIRFGISRKSQYCVGSTHTIGLINNIVVTATRVIKLKTKLITNRYVTNVLKNTGIIHAIMTNLFQCQEVIK